MGFRTLFSKKKPAVKQQLSITQEHHNIIIEGILGNPSYSVKELRFFEQNNEITINFPNGREGNQFKFSINLLEQAEFFNIEEGKFNLFIIVAIAEEDLTEKQIKNLQIKPSTQIDPKNKLYSYPIRLGRFKETITKEFSPAMINGKEIRLYKTVKGNLSLAVNQEVTQPVVTQMDYLKSSPNAMAIGGKLFTRTNEIEEIELLIIGRENNIETALPVHLQHLVEETNKKFGLNRYKFTAKIDLNDFFKNEQLDSDVYDFYFRLNFANVEESTLIRVGKPRFRARYRLRSCSGQRGDRVFVVSPYYTVKGFKLSMQAEDFDPAVFQYLKKAMRWAWLLRLFYKKQDIWIVGERPYKAQDTGYRFFQYMREQQREKNCYYVIDEHSPELPNVKPFGNILFYKSKEHVKKTLVATRVISSHHPDYIYPLRTKEFKSRVKARKNFIQHGVLGVKNIEHFYSKRSPSFSTDLFFVSSEREKQIVMNDLGYGKNEVAVTGLSRFDSLFANDIQTKRQLLIIPTWREWLVRDDIFLESEYYERYKELVFHPALHDLAAKENVEIIFCLHPNMQKFSHYFTDAPIRVIFQGEVDVQDLLKESAMMITDYSSVAFDFSFLEKPIIYYQFDRRRFIGPKGSHLDLGHDLPGEIVTEADEIIAITEQYAKNNFVMKDTHKQKAATFLTYKDQRSSERIYQAIKEKPIRKPLHKRAKESELFAVFYNRFRKNKYYFPVMRLFYNIARRILPVDDKLILFESGIGKQYTDSPKNLYEEIVQRNLDYKKVWVYNKPVAFKDMTQTKRIKRLSPSYYYHLARAKVWINNQNFPTYIKKRKETTYVQTWHGTPLKKMLYDIDYVRGRSEDYLERVSSAVENWDYLISPSDYATNAFRSAFRYKGKVLETGYPRNDIFYDDARGEIGEKVKSRLHLPKNKKVILYAPTFRDNETSKSNHFVFDLKMNLHDMKQELGDEYIILLRMHVLIKNKLGIDEELQDFVFNVSDYPDMQELLVITDVLITDYSSVMFDFANTKRPMMFFTYDLEIYRDDVRGFYIDFEAEAPGPLVRTTGEIIKNVQQLEEVNKKYAEKYAAFHEKYCHLEDGQASIKVVDHLLEDGVLKQ